MVISMVNFFIIIVQYVFMSAYVVFLWLYFIPRHETILSVLRCIEALVHCFSKRRQELDSLIADSVNLTLKQIWTSSLRVIGVKHLTDVGFSLLTNLLKVSTVNVLLSFQEPFVISNLKKKRWTPFLRSAIRLRVTQH